MTRRLSLTIILIFSILSAYAIDGQWSGKIKLGLNELTLRLNFSKEESGKYKCTFDSPDQGALGIPAEIAILSKDSVSVDIPMIRANVNGRISNNEINGELLQSGMRFPLKLLKQESGSDPYSNRPQTPRPPFPYTESEITFSNPIDGATLSGTLTIPENPKENYPAVIMVSGSGLQNRDEELMGHKPFLVISDYLARNGIASLRYDDRGFGKSTGDNSNATTDTYYSDAVAGIDALRKIKGVGKIGVLGHSEGGAIALIAGADKKADFVISLAGPAITGDSILVKQNRAMLKGSVATAAIADDYCRLLSDVFSILKDRGSKMPESEARQTISELIHKNNYNLSGQPADNIVKIATEINEWLMFFIKYDPSECITKLKCPIFALNGSKDTQVESESNLDALRKNLPADNQFDDSVTVGKKQSVIKEYPGLNHLFQHCATGSVNEYAKISETISPEVLSDIAIWINNQ